MPGSTFLERPCYHALMAEMTPFGALLHSRLGELDMTQAEFGARIDLSERYTSNILYGRRTLPLEQLTNACRALKLAAGSRERAHFERMAYLSHAPEEVSHMIEDLERQLANRREQVVQLVAEMRRRGIELPESVSDL